MLIWKDRDSVLLFRGEDITFGEEVPADQIDRRHLETLKKRGQVGEPDPIVVKKSKKASKKGG